MTGPWMRTVMRAGRIVSGASREVEKRHFISSVSGAPEIIIEMRVRHWDVEVARFRLDKSFDEDKSKIYKGGAPVVTSFLRKLALNFITPISFRHADVSARTVSMA